MTDKLLADIAKESVEVTDDMLEDIATISANNDSEIGGIIADAYRKVGHDGIVSPDRIWSALGETSDRPKVPEWVATWIAAEDMRPWPPMQD